MSAPAGPPPAPDLGAAPLGADDPYGDLLVELDESVRAIRAAALRLKQAAAGMQAVERNADRVLASTRILEINVSDLLRDTRGFASYGEDRGD